MSEGKHSTNVNDHEACALSKQKLLVRVFTDIMFSFSFSFLFFYVSLAFTHHAGKHLSSKCAIVLHLVVLFLISSVIICCVIFVLQSVFEFFKSFLIARNINSKTETEGFS